MKTIAISAALAVFLTSTVVQAANSDRVSVSREVRTAGLDLTSPEGLALLKLRVRDATRGLCGQDRHSDLRARIDQRRCATEAGRSADRQIELAVAKARNERFASAGAQVAVAPAAGF